MSGPSEITIAAPAKLNLGLRILGRRRDGYHELESLFVALDLCDRVRLAIRPGADPEVTLRVHTAPGVPGAAPDGPGNLASRAAAAFLAGAGVAARVEIELWKRIPSPGGLGGGSSDAAAVLRGLAQRYPGAVELAPLARSLGADVAFFLGLDGRGPVPAWVGGIGERIRPASGVPALALGLVHTGTLLETSRVYAEFDALAGSLTDPGGAPTMPAPRRLPGAEDPPDPDHWRSADWLSRLVANDLEPAARRLCSVIAPVREALAASGALAVGLSGSGPTLFGIFPDAPAASRALGGARIRALVPPGSPGWTGVAETVASPAPG